MRFTSNLDEPDGDLFAEAIKSFGLNSPSRQSSNVGTTAVNTIAQAIHDRGEQGIGIDGAWERNAPATIKKKGFDRPDIETGAMLSVEQIVGETTVDRNLAESVYGTDEECREKAAFAHGIGGPAGDQGQSKKGTVRPFHGILEADADAAFEGFIADFIAHLTQG